MEKITKEAIEPLLHEQTEPVASIYLPTHRTPTPDHINQDKTRFKNLVDQARSEWSNWQDETKETATLFDQLLEKLEDTNFWKEATEGLAIFLGNETVRLFRLPLECDECVTVERNFYTLPLLVLLDYDQPFYVLTLSTQSPQLFKGDMSRLTPAQTALPSDLSHALHLDEPLSVNTVKSSHGPGGPRGSVGPHGEGDSQESSDADRARYFRLIEDAVVSSDDFDDSLPILLAGTDATVSGFSAAARQLTHLAPVHLKGNYDKMTPNTLHAAAWPLIRQAYPEAAAAQLSKDIAELAGSKRASTNLSSIKRAAQEGRVASLLVAAIYSSNDTIDDTTTEPILKLSVAPTKEASTINQLAQQVIAQGGTLVSTDSKELPDNVSVAALYRYGL